MKALVLQAPGQLIMKEVPKPVLGADELLIKTKAATICTSDLHDIEYNPFGIKLPMIMGHEGAGVVEAVGEGVTDFKTGDEVAAHPVIPCRVCESCKRGLEHLCDNMGHLGIDRGGAFAEYFTIRQDRARKKPASLSFAESTLMEPVCVCIEALERANMKDGNSILIIGDGPFGILMSRLCKVYKDAKVILLGRHPFRMERAGNAITINERTSDNPLAEVMKATDGKGVDSAVLCVGTNQALDLAVAALRPRGTLSVFSAIAGRPTIDMFKVHVKELNICGSCNDMNYLDRALEYLQDEELNLKEVITHQLPFDRFEEAFRLVSKGKDSALKVSLIFE
ncbi:MAG: alcohol dehydrogenase catalytic domain-containing protein [Clostridiales bacterium]|jgi:threonine dehydrogenase-like Zn-dependent dehydrogenase|nr:alcohol dehydrogenase catalytic domain-containing protein [Clostridiales bacterium]